jgi:GNAT superfamily N-acetyltransferase
MTIRIYKPVDDIAATLANIRQDALNEKDPIDLIRQEGKYRRCLASPQQSFRVAKIDGVDAGFASVLFNRDKVMVGDMFVMRAYQRRGAGSRLFSAAMKAARDEGKVRDEPYEEITWTSLIESIDFFAKVSEPYGGKVKGVINFSCATRRLRRPRQQIKRTPR